MGVVNVTPDSFSDGGLWLEAERRDRPRRRAARAGRRDPRRRRRVDAARRGAGRRAGRARPRRAGHRGPARGGARARRSASTPRSSPSPAPRSTPARPTSTTSPRFRHDPGIAALVAETGCDCCLMHMQGEPRTMQDEPALRGRGRRGRGVPRASARRSRSPRASRRSASRSIPGIGFGKTLEHNLELLRRLDEIAALGFPVVVGVSRKRFLGTLTGRELPADRVAASVAANVLAFERGASVFRVHDVRADRRWAARGAWYVARR